MEQKNELMALIEGFTDKQIVALLSVGKVIASVEAEHVPDKYMTTEEAAEELGVTSATIRSYIKNGTLEGRRLSPRRFVVSSDSVLRNKTAQTRF